MLLQEVPGCVDLGHRGDGGDGDVGIIPVSDHDYPMDIVLTPSRTLILRNFRMARDARRGDRMMRSARAMRDERIEDSTGNEFDHP